ncbi:sialidase family protein [Pontibacter kalidii]|uniref:sialidase family protein n=1 Tax=Pontibacter kalidii TaxID=2592049 RepID=UPI00225A345D|nr:sialidase family protein [Pontibacter kalidii]
MQRLLFTLTFFFTALFAQAQTTDVPVFVSGQEGHKSYRIPAIIDLPNGDILAFAEGRVHGAADFGDVNIVMKRSSDKGKTWSALQTVVDYDTLQAGNAAPVVDLTDLAYPKGRIFLFYNTGNAHEYEVRSAKGYREAWYVTSTDNGQTWSEPVDITTQVHRPNMPAANPAYTFKEDWRAYANTPGHAIQFAEGKYKGRIYVAANHSEGNPKNTAEDYFAHGYYTDDHGKTFKISETVPESGGNEAMAAELTKGRLMMNIRNQQGDVRARIISISSDGGATWDTTYFDQQLPDPVNQGSILRIGKKRGKAILAFCNAADTQRRDNLTLRISYDEGKTWSEQHLIAKSPNNEKDYAAYSDLVKTGKKEIGVLYEKHGYQQIVFTVVKWKK